MATNSSQNLGLHLWEPDDQVLRTEFNENWQKIDTAVSAVQDDLTDGLAAAAQDLADLAADVGSGGSTARIAWGSYAGTGAYGSGSPTTLTFGFKPVLVVVGTPITAASMTWPTVLIRGSTAAHADNSVSLQTVTWTDAGVSWYSTSDASSQNNAIACTYYYAAVGYSE